MLPFPIERQLHHQQHLATQSTYKHTVSSISNPLAAVTTMILKRAARHLLLLGVALSPGAAGANVLHCPPAGESTVIVVADGGADNVSLTIAPSE